GAFVLRRAALANQRVIAPHGDARPEGCERGGLHLILRGWAARSTLLPDGRRQIIDLYLPGDLFGIGAALSKGPIADVEALGELVCGTVLPSEVPALLCDDNVAAFLLATLAREQRRVEHQLVMLGRMTAEERIAAAMLGIYKRLRRIEVP